MISYFNIFTISESIVITSDSQLSTEFTILSAKWDSDSGVFSVSKRLSIFSDLKEGFENDWRFETMFLRSVSLMKCLNVSSNLFH